MNYAVILAGGTGSRAGGTLPKQFQSVRGKRLIWWSVEAFKAFDPCCRIVLAVHNDFLKVWEYELGQEERSLGVEILKVPGGSSRFYSVKNALSVIEDPEATVFIHDGARPLVSPELIRRGASAVGAGKGAIPVIPIVDSIRELTSDGSVAVDRSRYVAVQTPQVFICKDIKKAYDAASSDIGVTDDASVAERFGIEILTFPGDSVNIKVTNPEDFSRL